jgi:hypothetical protein
VPVTLSDALSPTDLDADELGLVNGRNVGCFCLAAGAFTAKDGAAFREVSRRALGEELEVRLVREDGVEVACGSWLVAAGAGIAAVYSARGQKAVATPAPRAPINATGAATRATRTSSGGRKARRGRGCSARRARGPAKSLTPPSSARPKRYLRRGV